MAGVSGASPLRVPLLTAATTGTSPWVHVASYPYLTFYVKTNGSPGAGTLIIEEADWNPDKDPITPLTPSTITTLTITSAVGNSAQTAYRPGTSAYSFVRARIGTTITVATLDVVLCAV